MKRVLSATLMAVMLALCGSAYAGQIWTDGNGDGLPDTAPFDVVPGTTVTIDLWLDSESFRWSNFLAYVEWSSDCISYVSAQCSFAGCDGMVIDNFSHPRGLGFGGSGFTMSGVWRVGAITLQVSAPGSCCVTPIIDIYNPYYVFSQLGNGSLYSLFYSNPGTCFGSPPATGACCLLDQTCLIQSAAECAAAGGGYMGDGTTCEGRNCLPPQQGACCFPDSSCAEISPAECQASGGTYIADNATCEYCPQPLGACCLPDGSCLGRFPEDDCAANGGAYAGDGSDCTACDITGVESKSWGKIKGLFR